MKRTVMTITTLRLIGAVLLLVIKPLSFLFFAVYTLCGASDILDGYLARKFSVTSQEGAVLDSIADFVFVVVMLTIFIPILPWETWTLYWIGLIAIIRIFSLFIGFVKFSAVAFLHTYANKTTGLLLFLFPFLYQTLHLTAASVVICTIALLSALEELALIIKSKHLDRNVKGLLFHL